MTVECTDSFLTPQVRMAETFTPHRLHTDRHTCFNGPNDVLFNSIKLCSSSANICICNGWFLLQRGFIDSLAYCISHYMLVVLYSVQIQK